MAVQSTISQIQSAGETAQTQASSKDRNALGKDQFLKLLTEQLKHQDPTKPMDDTAFVAQLAQFSSLEQMSNVNDTLTKMLTSQGTALQTTATSMVGKTAVFTSDQVELTQGQNASIGYTLAQPAANISIVVQDEAGNKVRTITEVAPKDLKNSYLWNGRDDKGDELPTGTYTAQVQAADLQGGAIAVTQSISARITGITFAKGTPTLLAGNTSLQLSDITELDE